MSEGIVFTRSGIYLLSASVLSWYHRQSRKGPPIYAVSEVWLFTIGCVFGLVIETIYHFILFGEYQDRAV